VISSYVEDDEIIHETWFMPNLKGKP
jgi:hypothetical protein